MPSRSQSSCSLPGRLRAALTLCALLLPILSVTVLSATAQNAPAPQTEPAPPPLPPVQFANPIPKADLAFLTSYAGQTSNQLWKDKRFKAVLKSITPRTEYHYGRDMPLSDALEDMLTGAPLPVELRDSRFLLITSRGGPILQGRGFVWIDLETGVGLGGVYFHPVNGEPTPTLAIFSRQLKDTGLSWSQLPLDFRRDVADWSRSSGVPLISVTYFIPDNGRKYPLLHDGDYCAADHPDPNLDQARCQQRNADAAEADMNAAYFMQETHNAANATAWMLGPDQTAWISTRESACGAALGCRILITRRRTRELLRR